ncbi:MAG: helix-turn-helix transcriptional regulator [Clostridia bacterium]|nr:helix-turn-helix transcriptional regulator [Clostridia bacterium]
MEFHEKLQALRKRKGITQEELASALYVSRTAISKWESGRGFPNIDSLKSLAAYYGVTVDTLLSGEELMTAAKEERTRATRSLRDCAFGLLDLCTLLLLFLPLFGQKTEEGVLAVSLTDLTEAAAYLRILSLILVGGAVLWGILTLTLQSADTPLWVRCKTPVSLFIGLALVLLFTVTRHPYAAVFVLTLTAVKAFFLLKRP